MGQIPLFLLILILNAYKSLFFFFFFKAFDPSEFCKNATYRSYVQDSIREYLIAISKYTYRWVLDVTMHAKVRVKFI